MKIKAVIFDLDGTLLDTIEDLADSMNTVLRMHKMPEHPTASYFIFVGNGAEMLVKRALPVKSQTPELLAKCTDELNQEYQKRYNSKTRLYPGIKELLTSLQEKKISINIFSNKNEQFVQQLVNEYFSPWHFDFVKGAQADLPKKPHPAGALAIIQGLNLSPAQCLYVGDTNTDMQTAKAAKIPAVGVSWGFRSVDELNNWGAEWIIQHPLDLLELL